jgi:hypothetical protein
MSTARKPPDVAPEGGAANGHPDRRRSTVARFRFEPDPRLLRGLLEDVGVALSSTDPLVRRKVGLLVGEIVARLLERCPDAHVDLDLEIKADSVRIDIVESEGGCDFWEAVDEELVTDLARDWGRDRRGVPGAWFEVGPPDG